MSSLIISIKKYIEGCYLHLNRELTNKTKSLSKKKRGVDFFLNYYQNIFCSYHCLWVLENAISLHWGCQFCIHLVKLDRRVVRVVNSASGAKILSRQPPQKIDVRLLSKGEAVDWHVFDGVCEYFHKI